jgi:hypothetical protein
MTLPCQDSCQAGPGQGSASYEHPSITALVSQRTHTCHACIGPLHQVLWLREDVSTNGLLDRFSAPMVYWTDLEVKGGS